MTTPGRDRVRDAIRRANRDGRAALIIYLPVGYPDLDLSRACLEAAVEGGADLLEIGFPFSDPMMDGPTIQAAAQAALDAGTTVADDLAVSRSLTDALGGLDRDVPALVMTYVTIPAARGYGAFADAAVDAGLAGAILPDLPVDEAGDWLAEAERVGLANVFLVAQTSGDGRLKAIADRASGFVYATSLLGVTGTRAQVADASGLVGRVREHTDLPVAVGIGVSNREQAAEVASYADGVIVGSAVVRAAGDGDPDGAADRVRALVADLRAGLDDAARS